MKHAENGLRVMEEQGLRHCSVLVVDDSASSRTLLATTLQDIGVGMVHSVPSGAAAIDHLRHTAHSTSDSFTPPVDLVISEWDMEPVGGMMLLNWLRRHMASPDRFMRTVIMSGELDAEKVERARNAGANAVFAKPFTLKSMRTHLRNVLFTNPPFFKTKSYFGPDRRRHCAEVVLEERRRIVKPYGERLGLGQNPDIGCFDLPHYFSEMALGRTRERIDFGERNMAHQVLARHSEDYADWVRGDADVLRLAFRLADENPTMRARNMSLMTNLVLRLEREGDFMGYPLITAFAHTLSHTLRTDAQLWVDTAPIFDAALTGLDTVIKQNIKGNGGSVGQALHASLGKINKRLLQLHPMSSHRQGVAHLG